MSFSKEYRQRAIELKKKHDYKGTFVQLAEEFPDIQHPNEKTIRRWRKFAPAHIAIEQNTTNPITVDSIKKHYQDLTKVAKLLLDNDLDLAYTIPEQ